MTSINDMADLVQALRQHPEWRDTVRGLIIGEELAAIPQSVANLDQALATYVENTERNIQAVNQRLEALETEMRHRFEQVEHRFEQVERRLEQVERRLDQIDRRLDQLDRKIDQINGRLDNGFGANYEIKIARNIATIARQHLQLRRPRILTSYTAGHTAEWLDLIETAYDRNLITNAQADQVLGADLVLVGEHGDTGPGTYLVAEISITAGAADINRCVARANIVRAATGQSVLPAIISVRIDEERSSLAAEQGVAIAHMPE